MSRLHDSELLKGELTPAAAGGGLSLEKEDLDSLAERFGQMLRTQSRPNKLNCTFSGSRQRHARTSRHSAQTCSRERLEAFGTTTV
jgi:hypothetical protein